MSSKYWIFIGLLFIGVTSHAQRNILTIGGVVHLEDEKLEGVKVRVMQEDVDLATQTTEKNGKFKFDLDLEANYIVLFSKPGLVTKKVSIKAMDIPPEAARFGFENLRWDVSMIPSHPQMDLTLFDRPIAQMKFDSATAVFQWDIEYIQSVQEELKAFEERLEFVQDSLANAQVIAKQNQEEFERLFREGFELKQREQWEQALPLFEQMQALQPNNPDIAKAIEEIKAGQRKERAEAALLAEKRDEQNELIAEARQHSDAKDYQKAIQVLEKAKALGIEENRIAQLIYEAKQHQTQRDKVMNEFETNLNALELTVNELDMNGPYYAGFIGDYEEARDKLNYVIKTSKELGLQSDMVDFQKQVLDELKGMYDERQAELAATEKAKADSLAQIQNDIEQFVRQAKTAEANGDKTAALLFYKNALKLDPNNRQYQFKVNQLSQPEYATNTPPKTETKDFEVRQFASADELQAYQNELGMTYPEGMTEEVIELDNKTIWRRIVVKDGKGSEYLKIVHNWGGKFYFKNGLSITNLSYDQETDL